MLWRVRATLPDQPGALAALAVAIGDAGFNIMALQVFPGLEAVTDEVVLSTPAGVVAADVEATLNSAGAQAVVVQACTESALSDQPTLYVRAAREILQRPSSFPEVVARLFDAEPDPIDGASLEAAEFLVGEVAVAVHRTAPFTPTEQARGEAIAGLVSDVLARASFQAPMVSNFGGRRLGAGAVPEYSVDGHRVSATIDGEFVGHAVVRDEMLGEGGVLIREVDLEVDPAWQRRGIGTRLLSDVSRLAHDLGAEEVLLTTRADNQAVLPMVMAAGMRGRIRMAGDVLTVRVPLSGLKPLPS